MNKVAAVESLMTRHLITVSPEDSLAIVRDVFKNHTFHHLPVVQLNKIVGMISKLDYESYHKGLSRHFEDRFINDVLLRHHKAEEIMTKKLGKVAPDDTLSTVIEIFRRNLFHALPVVNYEGELVGILTTWDIINALSNEKIKDSDYITAL